MQSSNNQSLTPLSISQSKTSTNGLQNYLSVQNHYDFIRKRIKMLAQISSHNQAKLRYHQSNLSKMLSFRQAKTTKSNYVQYQLTQLLQRSLIQKTNQENQKNTNNERRTSTQNKIKSILKQITEQKVQQSNKIRAESKTNAKKITQNKTKQYLTKRTQRNKIIQFQQQSKQNSIDYTDSKIKDFDERKLAEFDQWNEKRQIVVKEIEKISKIQLEILNKHSETFQEFHTVKRKIEEIVKKGKGGKKGQINGKEQNASKEN